MTKDQLENQSDSSPDINKATESKENTAKNYDRNNSDKVDLHATHHEISAEENTIQALKQQLELLKSKSDQNFDLAVRAKAELENVRKRAEQDVNNAHKFALERFIPELFPLLDALEQGLNTVPKEEQFAPVIAGMNLCIRMFEETLTKFGLEVVDPFSENGDSVLFDPALHEAIMMQPKEGVANGSILKVIQKGYMLHKRVLRPARVIVAKS